VTIEQCFLVKRAWIDGSVLRSDPLGRITPYSDRGQGRDVAIRDQWWQLDKSRWRHTLAGQTVTIHQHLNGTVSIRYGPSGHFEMHS
jgi:hypothetical protein